MFGITTKMLTNLKQTMGRVVKNNKRHIIFNERGKKNETFTIRRSRK
jgi:hypothetical protein